MVETYKQENKHGYEIKNIGHSATINNITIIKINMM